jgi:hypothetical protein
MPGRISDADRRVEKLRPDHTIKGFDCSREELNRYLLRYAWANQRAGAAETHVGLIGESVIGYHTARASGGRPPLARLRRWKALLKDAMQRTLQAAEIAGIRAFAVHAKDEEARSFYKKLDFIPSPTDPMHLFVLLKDVRRIVEGR